MSEDTGKSSQWKAVHNEIASAVQAHRRADYATAFSMFKSLAENGHAESQFNLSRMYRLGQGVARDERCAVRWLEKSAQGGCPEAQLLLGMSYSLGDGVPQDDKQAAQWLAKAADQERPEAQFLLGCMYKYGRGVTLDNEKAVTWWKRAADQGSIGAQLMLGMHGGEYDALFASLEHVHGDDYRAMINRVYDGFARGSGGGVMLLPPDLASALDDAKQDPRGETWARLKAVMLLLQK